MLFYLKLLKARNLNAIIELADKYVFNGDLEKIIEVTYSYREIDDAFLLNETLFEEFLGLTYPDYSIDYLWRRYKYKVKVQIVLIDDILKKVLRIKMNSRSESLRRGIFCDSLEYVKNILEISVAWVEFEMQKAWEEMKMTKLVLKKKLWEIEKKEKLAFGPKIIESSEEFSFCYNFVVKNHNKKKHKLKKTDQVLMKKYLKIIHENAKCDIIETPNVKKKTLKGGFLKNKISRKDYRKVFDSVCELYGLPQRTVITNAGSIYDGDTALEIPRNEAHACFTIERVLKLLTHEIESHYVNSYNSKILIWNFRGARNLPKEEGLAKFMEKIFLGHSYDDVDNITEWFFSMMWWEVLAGDDYRWFLRIMIQEYKCKKSLDSIFKRTKRNYSFEHAWIQHKDVAYFRWLLQIVSYLKEWWEFRKLFLWKVGFHDLDNIFDIYMWYDNKQEIVFPVFISDLIYYYFTNLIEDPKFIFSTPDYYFYLKKKYWFIDLESFHIIDRINNNMKKIQKLLKLLEKNILND